MQRTQRLPSWLSISGAAALAALVATGAGAAVAQDDTATSLSGFIAAGTCDALADQVHDLEDVDVGDATIGERVGAESAAAMAYSITQLDAAFDDLLAAPHAIVVPADGDVLACGEIGGYVDDGGLVVGLKRADAAGLAGMAFLWDDEDSVEVELYLPQEIGAVATP